MKLKWFVFWAVGILLILPNFLGEHLCKDKLLKRSNVSTELQSDVLLPCDFDPALLGSNKTADIAVQWRQINTTSHGLLEISLQGEAMFWNNKERRIKHFPKLSESGNFSLLLQKVQPYDLSLYTCELFNGTSSIGCQEIELQSQRHVIIVETHDKNSVSQVILSDRGNQSLENPIYDTPCWTESNYCEERKEEGISSDTPVYATVRKGKKVNQT
ncbi:hypothetical protein KOW79_022060 [Hemibagrus wyckioides]|uniref:Ig-like domain-containing protein n=1 Tax=Hemibagrus wyckioides TaxID=337641 RepID=A0A9D3N2Q8_9TELE|nr:hypothetical protein KOW79_022060 [Hemibagrus wyckioides]